MRYAFSVPAMSASPPAQRKRAAPIRPRRCRSWSLRYRAPILWAVLVSLALNLLFFQSASPKLTSAKADGLSLDDLPVLYSFLLGSQVSRTRGQYAKARMTR